jgi:hypothetical protein
MKSLFAIGVACAAFSAQAAEAPQCRQQTIEKSVFEMCFLPETGGHHDTYTLKADGVLVFAIADDYVEKVQLEHSVPDGSPVEFPLSKQGEKSVTIQGGCVPESKDGIEVARTCSFFWGKVQVVKDVRFEFK